MTRPLAFASLLAACLAAGPPGPLPPVPSGAPALALREIAGDSLVFDAVWTPPAGVALDSSRIALSGIPTPAPGFGTVLPPGRSYSLRMAAPTRDGAGYTITATVWVFRGSQVTQSAPSPPLVWTATPSPLPAATGVGLTVTERP